MSKMSEELKLLGYTVTEQADRVTFPFAVQTGKFAGQTISLGLIVPPDFPLTPPSGPHLSPRLLPINPQAGQHPLCGVQESPTFGGDWEYWSRPVPHWPQTERNAKAYMAHIHRLFDTQ